MANPVSAATFRDALTAEGVSVLEVGDWQSHNRNSVGPWGPVNGVMLHHTVTQGTGPTVGLVRGGYAGLPGPLCHGMIAKDGTVHLVGYGRANHAGGGDGRVFRAVVSEDYCQRPPRSASHEGSAGSVDGNTHFYGFECENLGDGEDPWPLAQYDAMVRSAAAVCRLYGWSSKSVIGHLEWSSQKIDPRGFDMWDFRALVAGRLDGPASA